MMMLCVGYQRTFWNDTPPKAYHDNYAAACHPIPLKPSQELRALAVLEEQEMVLEPVAWHAP
jgi:hypothetical protein